LINLKKISTHSNEGLLKARGLREALFVLLNGLALLILLALLTSVPADPSVFVSDGTSDVKNFMGVFGAGLSSVLLTFFGLASYLLVLLLSFTAFTLYPRANKPKLLTRVESYLMGLGFLLFIISTCSLLTLFPSFQELPLASNAFDEMIPGSAGGNIGLICFGAAEAVFGYSGAIVTLVVIFLISLSLTFNVSWVDIIDGIGSFSIAFILWLKQFFYTTYRLVVKSISSLRLGKLKRIIEDTPRDLHKKKIELIKSRPKTRIEPKVSIVETSQRIEAEKQKDMFTTSQSSSLPELGLLQDSIKNTSGFSEESLQAMSKLLEIKLADFNIIAEVISVNPGPVVTRFEIQPAPGIKVSQISNLSKDLARALSIISVRVVEVIPGKPYIGIEIPNEHRELVTLGEIVKSKAFEDLSSPLTLALGKDISGNPVVSDLAKMPHLLIAGTTGSGKSVAINTMILSLLYKSTPSTVRLILIDPKMLELSVYEGIPHLLTPVVTNMKEAANALKWCVAEMDRRYYLMSHLGVRNLAGYNKKVADSITQKKLIPDPMYKQSESLSEEVRYLEVLPNIVIVIDELSDMMMQVGKAVEELICRLAQKARASGIHLIVATQRPSVDVITGLIKANIPSRIAFQVSAKVDSRTILDQMGAESLLGNGDMLFLPTGASVPVRIHGAFVSDQEVHDIVRNVKSISEPNFVEEVITGNLTQVTEGLNVTNTDSAEDDPLYDQAVSIVTESRRASISYVQRRLKIGYNRAARMIETMEASGIVAKAGGSNNLEVVAPPPPE
jgi:DNA segregation ATPase FtsK/SpoIIIE, S-DNA-T family